MDKINTKAIRDDFPILQQLINGKPLVYLDNAATTQKPKQVLDAIVRYYQHDNANVHRGVHTLSYRAEQAYSVARESVRKFINARGTGEIIFTRGTTEAINLVAQSYGRTFLRAGDEIVLSYMEHHSNIVPWQLLCEEIGCKICPVVVDQNGELNLDNYAELLHKKPKLVSLAHVSNVLGTINPVKQMIQMAHDLNIPVMLDGAQAIAHIPVDVMDLDCDFYAFSGHKMYAPMGIGVLYAKQELLDKMPPYQGGGGMIRSVSFTKTNYADSPERFEAGTPNVEGAVGLSAAIDYLEKIDMENVAAHGRALLEYATSQLDKVSGIRIIGNAKNKVGVISFVLDNIHPHDIGTIIDMDGVAIRAGHHCAMPLLSRFELAATARASFGIYNTKDEVDALVQSLNNVKRVFSHE